MYISSKDWKNFIKAMSKINGTASDMIVQYVHKNGFSDTNALVGFAYDVVNTMGNASAALAAEMYDRISELEGMFLEPAVLADTPEYGEVAKTVQGTLKQSENPKELGSSVGRLVKRTGQDTLLKNAIRDGAEFAWIPSGDTCAFCLTLASRGWQKISKKALRNGHAEHIHSNCDCSYMIRHSDDLDVSGYNPQKYKDMYDAAEGDTPAEKINSMRRMRYAERKDIINAQKRAAYAEKKKTGVSEKERLYRSYPNTVRLEALDAPGYIEKFQGITGIEEVDNEIYKYANQILKHRNGTNFEDIVFIDANTGELIHELTTCDIPNGVVYDDKTIKAIKDAHEAGREILAIHNHPGGLPPTLDDGVSAYDNDYKKGVAVGHNLEVYDYTRASNSYTEEECKAVHQNIIDTVQYKFEFDDSVWYNALRKLGMEVIRR